MRRKDGSPVPVEAVVTGVRLPDGSTVYVGSNRDISERLRLEQLQQDFIRMVSHDLRSPLTSIRGLAQLMQRRGQYNAQHVTQLIAQADRMQSLLTDLLEIEQIELGQFPLRPEQIDLVAVVRACVDWAAAHGSQHDIGLDLPDGAVRGWWDRGRLEQVCENLLSNALKYTPDGGRIRVSVRQADDAAVIEVHDTGIGIPAEALPHLFTRFYRVNRDGSQSPSGIGLGLYITRMLVDVMDGDISVATEVGRGSAFTVTLPIRSGADCS
jgi:signal transduction histidine kinase